MCSHIGLVSAVREKLRELEVAGDIHSMSYIPEQHTFAYFVTDDDGFDKIVHALHDVGTEFLIDKPDRDKFSLKFNRTHCRQMIEVHRA